jgi:hypothetical protein
LPAPAGARSSGTYSVFQRIAQSTGFMASVALPTVTYIVPLTTMGLPPKPPSSPTRTRHTSFKLETLLASICCSGE